jgi:hypothetical protein
VVGSLCHMPNQHWQKRQLQENQKTLGSAGKSNYQVSRATTASTVEKGKPSTTVGSDFCADRCNSRTTTELCQV